MLLIIGTIRLPPDNLEAARPVMQCMVEASRREEGCLDYSYAQDVLDASLIHVKEVWRDRTALDLHFASPHISEWRAAWPRLGIRDRRLISHEVGEGREV